MVVGKGRCAKGEEDFAEQKTREEKARTDLHVGGILIEVRHLHHLRAVEVHELLLLGHGQAVDLHVFGIVDALLGGEGGSDGGGGGGIGFGAEVGEGEGGEKPESVLR